MSTTTRPQRDGSGFWHPSGLSIDEWLHRDDFEACAFINVLLEVGPEHPAGSASILYLEKIRELVRRFADEAGVRDTEAFARSWDILMKGSIVSAAEGRHRSATARQDDGTPTHRPVALGPTSRRPT